MSVEESSLLRWINVWDNGISVWGLALVKNGFKAELHRHQEDETYYFIFGEGKMRLGDQLLRCVAPTKVNVPGNVPHAMTPVSHFVILLYHFPSSNKQFNDIKYTFTNSFVSKPKYPSKIYSCPIVEDGEEELVRTSKL
jgi:hypothetical protein